MNGSIKTSGEPNDNRNYGIDVLKVLAIFLILLGHFAPGYGDSSLEYFVDRSIASLELNTIFLQLGGYCAQIGNAIFVVCSSYYLCTSHFRKGKVSGMILEADIISWLILLFFVIFLRNDFCLNLKDYLKSFFPVTSTSNWFVDIYIYYFI